MPSKAVVVASIMASHELAQGFNDDLFAMHSRRPQIVNELVEEANRSYSKLRFEYKYRTLTAKHDPFLPPGVAENDPVRVVRVWVNKEEWIAVSLRTGVKIPPIPERMISSIYYRVDGVMVSCGASGYDILNSNCKVSDEQWEALKAGEVEGLVKPRHSKSQAA